VWLHCRAGCCFIRHERERKRNIYVYLCSSSPILFFLHEILLFAPLRLFIDTRSSNSGKSSDSFLKKELNWRDSLQKEFFPPNRGALNYRPTRDVGKRRERVLLGKSQKGKKNSIP
jgi:hypothetical protein